MSRLWRFPVPNLPSSAVLRTAGVYTSGALLSLGFWFFIDASVYSKTANHSKVHISIIDWLPLICSLLGMLVINSIERSRLVADAYSYSGNGVAWKAKLVLFMGFALMAGGLAGSATVLTIKYLVKGYSLQTVYLGIAGVLANALVMLSSVVLWVSQNIEEDYTYNLSLS